MDLNAEKIELAKRVLEIDDEGTLQNLKAAINGVDSDWWNELDNDTRASIERGLEQSQNGELYDHDDVMKNIG